MKIDVNRTGCMQISESMPSPHNFPHIYNFLKSIIIFSDITILHIFYEELWVDDIIDFV